MKQIALFAALALSSTVAFAAEGETEEDGTTFDFWAWVASVLDEANTRYIVKSDGVIYD